jgi:hypothetical protein
VLVVFSLAESELSWLEVGRASSTKSTDRRLRYSAITTILALIPRLR